ncbi:hypothetical protein [Actinomycetospora sp. NBRC 106378]|uniref:hypothetical protein n=1 Tax=Actinomycetospora sp. NBRC 106378 TaxID=3032208 RepID=UPI0024A06F8B|nr:hypothetical protein [Actinomycetospora sp. NBRC 106378]GLZ51691.1 hypothetical protein Acsp07_13080 [Actinomycetospora sp. NBRC 106378]
MPSPLPGSSRQELALVSPDEIRDRETFGAAIRSLMGRGPLSREESLRVTREAQQRHFVVEEHRRATVYAWRNGSLPQKSEGPYLGFLLAHRVPVDELGSWIRALERARTQATPPASAPSDPEPVPEAEEARWPDGEGGAPAAPAQPSDEDNARHPGRRRWPLVAAGVGLVVVLIGVTLVVRTAGSGAAPQLGSPLPSTVEEPFLREDFDELSGVLWRPPSEPAHMFAADRVLNLVGATDADPREIDVDLEPRSPQDFREIDFTVSIRDARVPGAGGGSLVLTEQDGRTHKLVFGPTPSTPPTEVAGALICSRPSCRSYDDYDPPPPTRPFEFLSGDEVVPFRVVQNDGTLTFLMRGQVMGQAPLATPLRSFRFNAYSGPEERWRITVDALRVYR